MRQLLVPAPWFIKSSKNKQKGSFDDPADKSGYLQITKGKLRRKSLSSLSASKKLSVARVVWNKFSSFATANRKKTPLKHLRQHILIVFLVFLSACISSFQANGAGTLKKVKYNYLLHIPENYDQEPGKKWPVIFYLHGRHASGKNLQSLRRYGLPYYISKGKKMDFIVVSPQCPWGKNWASEDWFNPVYDEVAAKLRIDESRVYLIGMSMGGFGTWELASRMPGRFAAISPMCGGANLKWVDLLSKIPTWVFHGTADRQIPISRSEVMVKALEKKNANLRFTRLINQGHDISKQFDNDDLYAWLKQFSLEKKLFWEEPLPFMTPIGAKLIFANPPFRASSTPSTIR